MEVKGGGTASKILAYHPFPILDGIYVLLTGRLVGLIRGGNLILFIVGRFTDSGRFTKISLVEVGCEALLKDDTSDDRGPSRPVIQGEEVANMKFGQAQWIELA